MPIAYTPYANTIELHNSVKLNSKVPLMGGGYKLDRTIKWNTFSVEIDFSILSQPKTSRGMEVFLTHHDWNENDLGN
jgi:hypothetical protein